MFNNVLRDLRKEAENQRRYMERHIRAQMGTTVPTADACEGTETFDTIHTLLIEDYKMQQSMKAKKAQEEADNKRAEAFQKQIRELEIALGVKTKIIKD
jgi:BMFP domain-containing protein YqiC